MSTKSLQRTPLEAGHTGHHNAANKIERASIRAKTRQAVGKLKHDSEEDFFVPEPKVSVEHDDRLGAIKRWIRSQVNRPWNKVFSEIKERFDARSLAGYHIIYGHLIHSVLTHAEYELHKKRYANYPYSRDMLYIDKHGILKLAKAKKLGIPWRESKEYKLKVEKAAWLAGREICLQGAIPFWVQTKSTTVFEVCRVENCNEVHQPHPRKNVLSHKRTVEKKVALDRLSKSDEQMLRSFERKEKALNKGPYWGT